MSENTTNDISGIVLEIQRLSTEDGPGIRSTVFMKGCSLDCQWCHNPESIDPKPQIQWISSRCISCKTCLSVCKNSALVFEPYGIEINRSNCQGCGNCADQCPTNALEILGKQWKVSELVNELLKDKIFFEKSGGGVTISGGESTLQYPFVAQVMKQLKEQGVHTALDTCGLTSWTAINTLLPYTDLVLYDLKEMDPASHKQHTGSTNEKILDVLLHICELMRQTGQPKEIWIRTPIIPQTTDYPDNIAAIGEYIEKKCADVVTRWDLLAFNNLCRDKYVRLGLEWTYSSAELISEAQHKILLDTAVKSLSNKEIINWNGNTQLVISEDETSPEIPFSITHGSC